MSNVIIIVDYNPQWPVMYEEEKDRILKAVGKHLLAIEHIGSTAVPGMGAKPIIDIMLAVKELVDAKHCITPLENLGYTYVPEFEAKIPERRFFRKGIVGEATHHLHLVELTSEFWEIHLLFRDYLKNHPDTAKEYLDLKKKLAIQFSTNRDGYTQAKTTFIESINTKARLEKQQTS